MKRFVFLSLLASCLPALHAQDVLLKDGKFIRSQGVRREGNFLFVKVANAEGTVSETLLQLNLVERIAFGEPPSLLEVRQKAAAGNAEAVLTKTEALLPVARPFADIPGNLWPELVRLRLSALAATPRPEALAELQKQWIPIDDPDLEAAAKLLASNQPGADRKTLEQTWKGLAVPGAATLSAGIAWLELGTAALEAKQWKPALRAFLSVEVFVSNHRLLQPRALLGAIRAFVGLENLTEAKALLQELQTEYPSTPEFKQATELILPPSTRPVSPE